MSDPEGDDLVIDLTGPEEDDWIKLSPAALECPDIGYREQVTAPVRSGASSRPGVSRAGRRRS